VSNETAAGKMGFEYATEKRRIEREKEEYRDQVAQGQAITPADIGVGDEARMDRTNGQDAPTPATQR